MDKTLEIADLMRRIVQAIVNSPEAVTIEVSAGGMLRVRIAQHDVGKVIGANGRTARALRQLLSSMAMTAQVHLYLDIVEIEAI